MNQSKPGGVSNGTLQPPCLSLASDLENSMYAKVFIQIFDSSLAENYLTRFVFEDLLILADKEGVVDMTPEAIARRTNVPLQIVKTALGELSMPDPKSRTPDEEGRRIVLLDDHRDWGWQIVNFKAYHDLRNEEGRRDYMRKYQRQRRKQLSTSVNTSKPLLAHTDTDKDKDKDKDKKDNTPPTKRTGRVDPFADAFKIAFDTEFGTAYTWQDGDFVQLAKFRKGYPDVTPEQFVELARACWAQGQFTSKASLTIRGVAAGWAQLSALVKSKQRGDPRDRSVSEILDEINAKDKAAGRAYYVRNADGTSRDPDKDKGE